MQKTVNSLPQGLSLDYTRPKGGLGRVASKSLELARSELWERGSSEHRSRLIASRANIGAPLWITAPS
jgi:hypothetical protein